MEVGTRVERAWTCSEWHGSRRRLQGSRPGRLQEETSRAWSKRIEGRVSANLLLTSSVGADSGLCARFFAGDRGAVAGVNLDAGRESVERFLEEPTGA